MIVSEKDAQILQIIVKHCDEIIEISRLFGKSKKEFIENYAYHSSCSMLIQTIGEVVKKISSDFLEKVPEIPWKDIKKMRNLFAHDYDIALILKLFGIRLNRISQFLGKFVPVS